MLFGDGAGAVVLGADGDRRRHRPDRCSPPTAALGDTIVATHDDRVIRMDGHSTFKIAVKRLSEVDASPPSRAPASSSTTSTCSSTTRPTAASSRAVGERLELDPAQSPTTSRSIGNTSRRLDPAHARACCARTAACAPATSVLRRRDRRGLHLGRRRHRVGDRVSRARERHRARHRRLARASAPRSRKALAADGWAVARQLPLRRGRRQARPSTRSRRPAAGRRAPRRRRQRRARRRCSSSAEERARRPVLALVNNAGVRADGLALQLERRGLGHACIDTNLTAAFRLTRGALRADDQGALRARSSTSPRSSARAPTPGSPTTPPPRPA